MSELTTFFKALNDHFKPEVKQELTPKIGKLIEAENEVKLLRHQQSKNSAKNTIIDFGKKFIEDNPGATAFDLWEAILNLKV